MKERFPNSAEFYTFEITEAHMRENHKAAILQQVVETAKESWKNLNSIATERRKEYFSNLVEIKKIELHKCRPHIQNDFIKNFKTDAQNDSVVTFQVIGRSNEDHIAVRNLDVNISNYSKAQIGQALFNAVVETNKKILNDPDIQDISAGSTLTACFVACDDSGKRTVYSAQLGDSCAFHLAKDKATRIVKRQYIKDEIERLKKEGAVLDRNDRGNLFIRHKKGHHLSISRGLGYKDPFDGVSGIPVMSLFDVETNDDDELLVLTCDGPYDLNNEALFKEIKKLKLSSNDKVEENELFDFAARICCLSRKNMVVPSDAKDIDDASDIVARLNKLKNTILIMCDGNSLLPKEQKDDEQLKLARINMVAKKACEYLPIAFKQELDKLNQNLNNNVSNNVTTDPNNIDSFHEPAFSQEFEVKLNVSGQIEKPVMDDNSSNDNVKVRPQLNLRYSNSDTENQDGEQVQKPEKRRSSQYLEKYSLPPKNTRRELFIETISRETNLSDSERSEEYAQRDMPSDDYKSLAKIAFESAKTSATKKIKPKLKRSEPRQDLTTCRHNLRAIQFLEFHASDHSSQEAQFDESRAQYPSTAKQAEEAEEDKENSFETSNSF